MTRKLEPITTPVTYSHGTVIANTVDPDWNPFVLTKDGWMEVGGDDNYILDESRVVTWLDDPDWAVVHGEKLTD